MSDKLDYLSFRTRDEIEVLKRSMSELRRDFEHQGGRGLQVDDKNRAQIVTEIKTKLSHDITGDFLRTIEEKYAPAITKEQIHRVLLEDFERTKGRLRDEISALGRRANVNLIIGSVVTVLAASVLTSFVMISHADLTQMPKILSYYIPRLSLIVFIEIFAYFFLRLYKANLYDIKYFQNELTNIESKMISLKSALISSDKVAIKNVIDQLAKTERNFFLRSKETTEELEKSRLENENLKAILGVVPKIVDKVKK